MSKPIYQLMEGEGERLIDNVSVTARAYSDLAKIREAHQSALTSQSLVRDLTEELIANPALDISDWVETLEDERKDEFVSNALIEEAIGVLGGFMQDIQQPLVPPDTYAARVQAIAPGVKRWGASSLARPLRRGDSIQGRLRRLSTEPATCGGLAIKRTIGVVGVYPLVDATTFKPLVKLDILRPLR